MDSKVPHRKTSFGQSSFGIKGADMWNSLPTELEEIHGLKQYKGKLKEYLKDKQICSHVLGHAGRFKCECVCAGVERSYVCVYVRECQCGWGGVDNVCPMYRTRLGNMVYRDG